MESSMSSQKLHQSPPFRAEHLGSLKRPDHLLDKRKAFDQNKITIEDLTPIEDAAIKDIVAKQLKWGFRGVSDGEFR
jgi:methionine synthase II (cobalamin-independent)